MAATPRSSLSVVFLSVTIRESTIHHSSGEEDAHVAGIELDGARVGAYSHQVNEVNAAEGNEQRSVTVDSRR